MTLIALSLTLVSMISLYAQSPIQSAASPVASPTLTPSPTVSPTAVVTTTPSPTPTSTPNPASTGNVTNISTSAPTSSASPTASESPQPQLITANPTLTGALIVGLIAVALMIGIYYATRRM
jgi:hypothetical protein